MSNLELNLTAYPAPQEDLSDTDGQRLDLVPVEGSTRMKFSRAESGVGAGGVLVTFEARPARRLRQKTPGQDDQKPGQEGDTADAQTVGLYLTYSIEPTDTTRHESEQRYHSPERTRPGDRS